MELQALPSRIGQVRRIVSAQLRYWHLDALIDRASLGVTELLSNVHRHAQPDKTCTVEIELLLDRLTVSVRDHDPRMPVVEDPQDIAPLATCGRGLAMVAAMSESWGVRPDGESGKVVWFTLPTSAPRWRHRHAGRGARSRRNPRAGSRRSRTPPTSSGPTMLPPGPPLPVDRAVTTLPGGRRCRGGRRRVPSARGVGPRDCWAGDGHAPAGGPRLTARSPRR
ncbi:ATP-binding protein [Streptomyces tuirus]|uniref:ATP-binding protein n=1 Tax=Streptomyces tuirus TaxID=68278 RepID=A0A941F9P0_9ACTN|nr:ATP-binding protein [Streptomyces tuirus]